MTGVSFCNSSKPGAVPNGFFHVCAPRGIKACDSTAGGILRPILRARSRMCSRTGSLSCNGRLSTVATALRVRSSGVGPRPPIKMTASARSSARRSASAMASLASPTVTCQPTRTLTSSRARARKAKLVSTVRPERTSLPIVMISTRMMTGCVSRDDRGVRGRRTVSG